MIYGTTVHQYMYQPPTALPAGQRVLRMARGRVIESENRSRLLSCR